MSIAEFDYEKHYSKEEVISHLQDFGEQFAIIIHELFTCYQFPSEVEMRFCLDFYPSAVSVLVQSTEEYPYVVHEGVIYVRVFSLLEYFTSEFPEYVDILQKLAFVGVDYYERLYIKLHILRKFPLHAVELVGRLLLLVPIEDGGDPMYVCDSLFNGADLVKIDKRFNKHKNDLKEDDDLTEEELLTKITNEMVKQKEKQQLLKIMSEEDYNQYIAHN